MNRERGAGEFLVTIFMMVIVGVGAYFYGKAAGIKSVTTTASPTPQIVANTPLPAETKDWKTYTYKNIFTLQYPQDWEIIKGDSGNDVIIPKDRNGLWILVLGETENDNLEKESTYRQTDTVLLSKKGITLNGHKAIRQISINNEPQPKLDTKYIIQRDKCSTPGSACFIVLDLFNWMDNNKNEYEKQNVKLEQILSTFKFN